MFFDDDDELDLYKDDEDSREYKDNYSEKPNSQMVGSAINIAKDFIDDTTKEVVNAKIREIVDDMASNIDTPKLGKSLLIGSIAGVLITIALYKILK